MSVITKIPPKSGFIPVSVRFTATYNAFTPFRYDFSQQTTGTGALANIDIPICPIKKHAVYLMSKINFTFTIPRQEYTTAVRTNPVPLLLVQILEQQKELIWTKPWPIGDFVIDSEEVIYFDSNQEGTLISSFRGVISQTAAMIPYSIVDGIFSAELYEIRNQKWIEEFNRGTTQRTGMSLNE